MNQLRDKSKRAEFLEQELKEKTDRDVFISTHAGMVVFLADIANALEEIRDELKKINKRMSK